MAPDSINQQELHCSSLVDHAILGPRTWEHPLKGNLLLHAVEPIGEASLFNRAHGD